MNLSNVLHGSSNGTRTNALLYVPQNLGLFPHHKYHARTNAVSTKSTPTEATEKTASVPRNSQICGSSATYRSTVPLFKSSNQMFYATQSVLRPLSRTQPTDQRTQLLLGRNYAVRGPLMQRVAEPLQLFKRNGNGHCDGVDVPPKHAQPGIPQRDLMWGQQNGIP